MKKLQSAWEGAFTGGGIPGAFIGGAFYE
jgi:hypothetical protein